MQTKYIILKADDFRYDPKCTISVSWIRFLNFVMENNIHACLGIIGNTISKSSQRFLYKVNDLVQGGNFELFNHGYNHFLGKSFLKNIAEFKNTPLWYQKSNILKTQELGKANIGFTFKTFGAPGNAIDYNTKVALERIYEIDVWFYGTKPSAKCVLDRHADAEYPTGNPVFTRFKESINGSKCDYAVLQLHPNTWDSHQFDEFKKIINFLMGEKELYKFITAYGYFEVLKKKLLKNRQNVVSHTLESKEY